MTRILAQLDGEAGATFKAVFDHLAAPGKGPDPEDPQQVLPGTADARSTAQRGADALATMARLAAASLAAGTRAGEGAPPACGGQAGPIGPALRQRLACDAALPVVVWTRPARSFRCARRPGSPPAPSAGRPPQAGDAPRAPATAAAHGPAAPSHRAGATRTTSPGGPAAGAP